MKTKYIALGLATALTLSSCSIFNSTFSKKSGSDNAIQTMKPHRNNKKTDKNKEMIENARSEKGTLPTFDQLTGGQWNIVSVGATQIKAEDNTPYIVFDGEGHFYAGDGCNVLNGGYALRSDGKMVFGSVLSTMKMCPDMEYADLIAPVFSDGSTYSIDCRKVGQDTYITLSDAQGKTVAELRRHNMEFLNGNWRITSAEGSPIDDEEANIFIDISELKVHGNTGCNFFNGDIYIEPSRSNAIDFSNMGLTRMACPKQSQERAIMVALEEATTAIAGKNDDTVLLLDSKGKQLMTLQRIPLTSNE